MTMPAALIRYPDAVAKVLEAVAQGLGMKAASDYAGIATRTTKYWLDRGRSAMEASEENDAPIPEESRAYVEFALEIGRLRAINISSALASVRLAAARGAPLVGRNGSPLVDAEGNALFMPGDWRAAAWWLERVDREEYGTHTQVEMSGTVERTLVIRDGDDEVGLDVRADAARTDMIAVALQEAGLLPAYPAAIEATASDDAR